MNKKKILIIDSFEDIGGGQLYIERLIELLATDYSFYVITLSRHLFKRLSQKNFNVFLVDKKRYFAFCEIKKLAEKINPDLILLNGQFEAHYSWVLKFSKKIFVRHTSPSMTSFLKRFIYFLEAFLFADKIVVVNDFMKEEMPIILHRKTEVIYNWKSQHKKIENKNRLEQKEIFNVLYCGRLVKEKNVDVIIEACKDLKNVNLHIVGIGEEYDTLKRRYAEYANIIFHGYVEYENIENFYKSADIYVSLSNIEAFPLAVLDAFYYGLPTILSNIPAHRDISKDGWCALLINVDVNSLKSALLSLIKNPYMRQELSKRALIRANDFSDYNAKQKYINLINEVINFSKIGGQK